MLGLELGRQDVPGLKNTGENFLASGRSHQDVADPKYTTISYEQKWTQLLQNFKDKDIPISNFQKLVEFVFCLPGTSAPVERIFSIMKNMWSDDRSSMHEKNVKALLVCKSNIDLKCTEVYENIKSNVVL